MGFPPAQTYQKALFNAGIPATAFLSEDIQAQFARFKERGVIFHGEPKRDGPNYFFAFRGHLRQPDQSCSAVAVIADRCWPPVSSRVIRKSPSTSASICVRAKQSMASCGLHTMGSLSLNDVLSTTGTPVCCSNARISFQ